MDIESLLQKRKKRLGLSDWEITVKFKDAVDMNASAGMAVLRESLQMADIRLLDKSDRQKSNPSSSDIELDLVHELIHVRLWSIDPKDAEGALHACREQAIEWIAKALIISDRENKEIVCKKEEILRAGKG